MMTHPRLHAFVPPIFITAPTILLFVVFDVLLLLLFLLPCRQGAKGQRGENGDASLHAATPPMGSTSSAVTSRAPHRDPPQTRRRNARNATACNAAATPLSPNVVSSVGSLAAMLWQRPAASSWMTAPRRG